MSSLLPAGLKSVDFLLWCHLETKIYASQLTLLDNLRQIIIVHQLSNKSCLNHPRSFQNVRKGFEENLYYFREVEVQHFQHLLD